MAFSEHFEHLECEQMIYDRWIEARAFTADVNSSRSPFSISMPPPNATGTLHLGHAIMLAIEDVMVRWRRMAGYETLWVPGTDHAAIATESVVIKKLQREGLSDPRAALGREGLIQRISDYVENSRATIRSQICAMGASCDWTRERYTMDAQLSRCVAEVFASMFRDGLIYRGPRIVNWDVALQTTISDDEIEHVNREAKFYTIQYGPFLIGTSRPETKLGDTAVAVHPDDERWRDYIGQTIEVQWPKGPTIKVKVIADSANVDMAIGTGAVGVTPAHSRIDFEMAQVHNLPIIQVIGEDGRMTNAAGPYAGLTISACREAFVSDLAEAGLLKKVESYSQPIPLCYRSKQPIEPLPKDQWFIDVNKPSVSWQGKFLSLKQIMRQVIETGHIRILPDDFVKTYYQWIDNLHDWCISRQIWWGHRIPVWYRGAEDVYVGYLPPTGEGWQQDPDTLDTWFSSALWTWGTLVNPAIATDPALSLKEILERSPDFMRFHPTSVMETGYDILFFWVARMILMTTYAIGDVPFGTVYLHGLILDKDGDKMAKTKPETCIDPIDVLKESGADPLRLSLILSSTAGRDTKLGKDHIIASGRLVNKLWNAGKLVSRIISNRDLLALEPEAINHPINRWMMIRVSKLIVTATGHLESYSLNLAADAVRESFWREFCDFYLEAIKLDSLAKLNETPLVLLHTFDQFLRLFHPFIPFVTEQIWLELRRPGLLITAEWPHSTWSPIWTDGEGGVNAVVRLISSIRSLRSSNKVDQKAKVNVLVAPKSYNKTFLDCYEVIAHLACIQEFIIDSSATISIMKQSSGSVAIDESFCVAISLAKVDMTAEIARLTKQFEEEGERLRILEKRLGDELFLTRAKPEIVDSTRSEAARSKNKRSEIENRIKQLRLENT